MTNTPTPPKLLDREPSEAMIEAMHNGPLGAADHEIDHSARVFVTEMYQAAWDAAPASPPHDGDVQDRAAAYVDALDCNIQNRHGDWDGYSGQMMVAAYMAGAASSRPPVDGDVRPVAWRYRYIYPDRIGHWTVRQSPIKPYDATPYLAACEVEPLYLHSGPVVTHPLISTKDRI